MNLKQVFNLIKQHTGNTDIIAMDPLLIDFSGSICGGIFLSKLLYWSDKGKLEGGWIAKTYLEWYQETRLTEKQIRLLIKNLTGKGVETAVKKFNGSPTLHYRIIPTVFAAEFQKLLETGILPNSSIESDQREDSNLTKEQNESGQKGRLEPAEKADSLTKTTTEITTKTTTDTVLLEKNQNGESAKSENSEALKPKKPASQTGGRAKSSIWREKSTPVPSGVRK
ncbi:hypothetical protein AHMF7605_11955 [Adhaeribacter arboris]|uniref:Uncharacterized protein n=1 Tax=Adhaeribacter arboris TaxID=2072846 RepID=A0A2T2YF94_9BACT|nr:hypothetical protein [Adhaeribacter arboris]PSR54185.1 hypothetical protein AHMF7605_11955 [Adhaeribacter arboris]